VIFAFITRIQLTIPAWVAAVKTSFNKWAFATSRDLAILVVAGQWKVKICSSGGGAIVGGVMGVY
jgi:hypothetical protein